MAPRVPAAAICTSSRFPIGGEGPELFAGKPEEVPVAMPDEDNTWLVDLNRDGRQDILMHHGSATEPHRVTMLVAR